MRGRLKRSIKARPLSLRGKILHRGEEEWLYPGEFSLAFPDPAHQPEPGRLFILHHDGQYYDADRNDLFFNSELFGKTPPKP